MLIYSNVFLAGSSIDSQSGGTLQRRKAPAPPPPGVASGHTRNPSLDSTPAAHAPGEGTGSRHSRSPSDPHTALLGKHKTSLPGDAKRCVYILLLVS